MFKSVSFNIFEENLEEIVYRNNFAEQEEKNIQPDKVIEKTIQKTTELIIKPLNERHFDRYQKLT